MVFSPVFVSQSWLNMRIPGSMFIKYQCPGPTPSRVRWKLWRKGSGRWTVFKVSCGIQMQRECWGPPVRSNLLISRITNQAQRGDLPVATHSAWQKLCWTPGLLAPSRASVHPTKRLLASRCSFPASERSWGHARRGPGLANEPQSSVGSTSQAQSQIRILLDHPDHCPPQSSQHGHCHGQSLFAPQIHSLPSTPPQCPGSCPLSVESPRLLWYLVQFSQWVTSAGDQTMGRESGNEVNLAGFPEDDLSRWIGRPQLTIPRSQDTINSLPFWHTISQKTCPVFGGGKQRLAYICSKGLTQKNHSVKQNHKKHKNKKWVLFAVPPVCCSC